MNRVMLNKILSNEEQLRYQDFLDILFQADKRCLEGSDKTKPRLP